MRKTFLPYALHWIDDEDIEEVVKVLKSDWITTGPKIKEFEDSVCEYVDCKYGIAVNSGTSALDIAVACLGLESGEVITTPFTFVATANSILFNGLKPVFADIKSDTYNINPTEIRRKVTDKTRVMIYVDYAGQLCDIEEVENIAEEQIDKFLSGLKLNNILEVGCNVRNQLLLLQKGFFKNCKNLCGIELNRYAVEKSKERIKGKGIEMIQGSAFNIPFKDAYFDLVFTSGVLIHISPKDINEALDEIHRCSRKYIWGLEYFSEEYAKVDYRGHNDLLWKTNFVKLYFDRFQDLKLVKEKKYPYLRDKKLVDQVFLLKRIEINR